MLMSRAGTGRDGTGRDGTGLYPPRALPGRAPPSPRDAARRAQAAARKLKEAEEAGPSIFQVPPRHERVQAAIHL